jgi:hypothetical protein
MAGWQKTDWLDPFYAAIWTMTGVSGMDSDPLFTGGSAIGT